MGFFLPSETARLVVSYLLDHNFNDTADKFMVECPYIQELKSLNRNQLKHHSRVNDRTLMDILREYNGLKTAITGLSEQLSDVPRDGEDFPMFEAPLRTLKRLAGFIKQGKSTPVVTDSNSTQTDPPPVILSSSQNKTSLTLSDIPPLTSVHTLPTQHDVQPLPQASPLPHINSPEQQPQDALPLQISQAPPLQNTPKGPQTQVTLASTHTTPISLPQEPLPPHIAQQTPSPDHRRSASQPTAKGPDNPHSRSQSMSPSKLTTNQSSHFFHSNIRVFPRHGYVPILPKPGDPLAPPPDPQPTKKGRKSQRKKGLDNVSGTVHSLPAPNIISDVGVLPSSLGESDQHSPSTSNTILIPSPSQYTPPTADTSHRSQHGSRKVQKPGRRSVDEDEDLLNELLGLGDQIATMINTEGGDISGMVDKGLDNPELQDNLHNLLDLFNTEPSALLDEEQVNTPISSPIPEGMPNRINRMDDNDETKGFDSTLTDMEITTDLVDTDDNPVTDALAFLVNSTIKTVTAEFNGDPVESAKKDKRKRRRKTSPKKKGQAKKKRMISPTKDSSAESSNINVGLNTFRMQFKSVLNNSLSSQASTSCQAEEILPDISVADDGIKEEDIIDEKDDSITIVDNLQNIVDVNQPVDIINEEVIAQLLAGSKKRHKKCRKCQGCKRPNCGKCKHCVDMVEFGGKGYWKKACELRKCLHQQEEMVECDLQVVEGGPQVVLETDKDEDIMPPPPQHVRNLMFSPGEEGERGKASPVSSTSRKGKKRRSPIKRRSREVTLGPKTPEKSILKTLSPVKQPESPIKETNPAWNQDLKVMFASEPIKSSIPFTEEVLKNMTTPICINKKISVPLGTCLPSTVVPVSPSSIPPEVLQALPPGFRSAGFKAIISDQVKTQDSVMKSLPSSSNASSLSVASPSVPPVPSSSVPPSSHSTDLPDSQLELEEEIESKNPEGNETSAKKIVLSETNSKKPGVEGNVVKKPKEKSPKVMSWDEKLRASLGSAEKDMSHITHKIPDNEKGRRRRSPRKRRRVDRPESDEDEEGNVEEDEGTTLPELGLEDADITPEAQRILDTFANKLLEQLEETTDAKVVFVDEDEDYLADRKLFGASKKKRKPCQDKKNGKDCIECRLLDCVEERPLGPAPGMPVISNSPLKPNSGSVSADKGKTTGKVSSSDATITTETVTDVENNDEIGKATDTSIESAVSSTSTYVAKPMASSDLDLESSPVPTPFKTPQKSDSFLFKTPQKTPRTPRMTRHLLASPLQHLMSPQTPGRRRAVPLTPSRPTFSPKEVEPSSPGTLNTPGRERHQSSLSTPVHEAPPDQLAAPSLLPRVPTTPTSKAPISPSVPYFTPSPTSQASRGSHCTTPGLRFLQEEGERLSHSEDSMSPTKSELIGKRKSFRNCLFNKASRKETKLGTLLEQKISNYQFQEYQVGTSGPAPFMGLDRPSPSGQTPQQASFVSPNRTCYLSPTAMALSDTVLGFHQSPRNTDDSDNTDMEMEDKEIEQKNSERIVDHEEIIIYNNPDVTVTMETATDSAVQDTEETIEAIQACVNESFQSHSVRSLSDESNTASLPQPPLNQKQTEVVISPDIPSLVLSEGSDSETEDVMVQVTSSTERKIKTIKKVGSFVESFLEAKSKDSIEEEGNLVKMKETEKTRKFTPRKPRRVKLTSTSRKSPLKNDATLFERSNDVNNLDRSLPESAGKILEKELEKENLGTAATIDLGLEPEIGFGQQKKGKTKFSMIETRKSPRKIKSSGTPTKSEEKKININEKGDGRPQKKRLKMSEFDENRELSLQFSPRKSKRQTLADDPGVSLADISSPDKMTVSLPGSLGVYTTPNVCEALGLRPVKNRDMPLDESSSDTLSLLSKLEEARPKNQKKQIDKVPVKKQDRKDKSVPSSEVKKDVKKSKSTENLKDIQNRSVNNQPSEIQKKEDNKHNQEKASSLVKHPDKKHDQRKQILIRKEEAMEDKEVSEMQKSEKKSDEGKESKISEKAGVLSPHDSTGTEEIPVNKEETDPALAVQDKSKEGVPVPASNQTSTKADKCSASHSPGRVSVSSNKTDHKKQGNKERSRSKSKEVKLKSKPIESNNIKDDGKLGEAGYKKSMKADQNKFDVKGEDKSKSKFNLSDKLATNTDLDISAKTETDEAKVEPKQKLADKSSTSCTSPSIPDSVSSQGIQEKERKQQLSRTDNKEHSTEKEIITTSKSGSLRGRSRSNTNKVNSDVKERSKSRNEGKQCGEPEANICGNQDGASPAKSKLEELKGKTKEKLLQKPSNRDHSYNKVNEVGDKRQETKRILLTTSNEKSKIKHIKSKSEDKNEPGSNSKLKKDSSKPSSVETNKLKGELTKVDRKAKNSTVSTQKVIGQDKLPVLSQQSVPILCDPPVSKPPKPIELPSNQDGNSNKQGKFIPLENPDVNKHAGNITVNKSTDSTLIVKVDKKEYSDSDSQVIQTKKNTSNRKDKIQSVSNKPESKAPELNASESNEPLSEVSQVSVSDQKENKQKWKPKQIISVEQKKSDSSQSLSGDKSTSKSEENKTPTIKIKSPSKINKETKLAEEKERSRSRQLQTSTVRKDRSERDPDQRSSGKKTATADVVLQTSQNIPDHEVLDTSPRQTRSMSSGSSGNKCETRSQSKSPEKRIPNILRKTPTRKPLANTNNGNKSGGNTNDRSITLDHVGITSALNKAKEKQASSSFESNKAKNLNIDQLAESSAKLLSSLGMKAPQQSDNRHAELHIEDLESNPVQAKYDPPVISMSPFFIFLDKKPFGVFEGDD